MRFIASPFWKWKTSDFWDQPLHFICGVWLALPAVVLLPQPFWYAGALVSTVYGCRREYYQHLDSHVFVDLDSFIWACGAFMCIGVMML